MLVVPFFPVIAENKGIGSDYVGMLNKKLMTKKY
jgi:hypothetical protein